MQRQINERATIGYKSRRSMHVVCRLGTYITVLYTRSGAFDSLPRLCFKALHALTCVWATTIQVTIWPRQRRCRRRGLQIDPSSPRIATILCAQPGIINVYWDDELQVLDNWMFLIPRARGMLRGFVGSAATTHRHCWSGTLKR